MSENRNQQASEEHDTHPVDEVLTPGPLIAHGLQHVLAMYAGIIAVPLLLATAIGLPQESTVYIINASLLMSGVATLIQAIGFWKFGIRLPVVQGTSFAAVTPMILIGQNHGLPTIFGSVIVAGLLTVLAAPYFSKMLRFFPPVVLGSVITVIGLSLMPVAVNWVAGGNSEAESYGSVANISLAFGVFVLILAITRIFGGFLGRVAILFGLLLGTIFAIVVGITDFSSVGDAEWLGVTTPFNFGLPIFALTPIIIMTLTMLVVMMEATADMLAIGEITERPAQPNDIARGLRADGLSTTLAGLFNTFPLTAFAQNVGLVRFSAVKSRFVVAAGGVMLILLGLLPKLGALVASVPLPVLGGAGLMLFGTVVAAGIQILSRVDLSQTNNLTIVAASAAFGLIPAVAPEFYDQFPEAIRLVFGSGITAAAIVAILLNLIFNILGGERTEEGHTTETAAHAPTEEDVYT